MFLRLFTAIGFSFCVTLSYAGTTEADVKEIGNQCRAKQQDACNELAHIAETKKDGWPGDKRAIRIAAVDELSDQALLAEVAKKAWDWWVQAEAAKKLTDQAVLIALAATAKEPAMKEILVRQMTDREALATAAAQPKHPDRKYKQVTWKARYAAIRRLVQLRKAEVEQLTDQAAIAAVAKSDPDWEVRQAAIRKTTNQSFLADVSKQEKNRAVCKEIIARLTDQAALADLAMHSDDWVLRDAAVRRVAVADQPTLTKLAASADDCNVATIAEHKVIGPGTAPGARTCQPVKHPAFQELVRSSEQGKEKKLASGDLVISGPMYAHLGFETSKLSTYTIPQQYALNEPTSVIGSTIVDDFRVLARGRVTPSFVVVDGKKQGYLEAAIPLVPESKCGPDTGTTLVVVADETVFSVRLPLKTDCGSREMIARVWLRDSTFRKLAGASEIMIGMEGMIDLPVLPVDFTLRVTGTDAKLVGNNARVLSAGVIGAPARLSDDEIHIFKDALDSYSMSQGTVADMNATDDPTI